MQGSSQDGMSIACQGQWEEKMDSNTPPTLDEFRARAALSGLPLAPEDIEELHKGYVGLLRLMARIPKQWAWAAEPPHVFRAGE
jgi:hypothetical protein